VRAPEDYYRANRENIASSMYTNGPYKVSGHFDPPPSGVFVFIDENEQSIDSGIFIIGQPAWVIPGPDNYWGCTPSDRHNQGASLSFLDGHVEHWGWKAPKVFRGKSVQGVLAIPGGDEYDLERLEEAVPHDPVTPIAPGQLP
jgi:prepilin-type processing-associated H-X9-DG protein